MDKVKYCSVCGRNTMHSYAGKSPMHYDSLEKAFMVLNWFYPLAKRFMGEGPKKFLKCKECGNIVEK
jgi:hypothetical protein